MGRELSSDVRAFLGRNVGSVEALEVLRLLHSSPEKSWSLEALNERLRSSLASIALRLESLQSSGLVARAGACFRYLPTNPELERLIDELIRRYQESPARVISAIYGNPATDPVAGFADAFKFKPRKDS